MHWIFSLELFVDVIWIMFACRPFVTRIRSFGLNPVTSTNSSSEKIGCNPANPYNSPGGYKVSDGHWPASGYGPGSLVEKLTLSSYYMDRTSYRQPALMRHEYGLAPQICAYNVDGFRVWYQMQNGTWTRNPLNMLDVQKVMPVVATRLSDPRRPALVDSVWAALRPRSF